jgi:hypothetical protein
MAPPSRMTLPCLPSGETEGQRGEHRDLDAAIEALSDAGQAADRLQLPRLKKRNIMLRDKLVLPEDKLAPDIIA